MNKRIAVDLRNALFIVCSIFYALFLGKYIGSDMEHKMYTVLMILVIIASLCLYFFLSFLISKCFSSIRIKDMGNIICEHTGWFCSGKLTSKMMRKNYAFYPNDDLKERMENERWLLFQDELLQKEENTFYSKEGKEIWILSPNLATELKNGASEMVGTNLNDGVVYYYFYSKTSDNGENNIYAIDNMRLMNNKYENSINMKFFYYQKSRDEIDGYLFDMFGIVIYIYSNGDKRAYFSVRASSAEEIPIYLKMPWCMCTRYYEILKTIKEQQSSNL